LCIAILIYLNEKNIMNIRKIKDIYKHFLRKIFEAGQHIGFDILPRHFYSEIPDIRALRLSSSWKAPYSMMGVTGAELDPQLTFVRSCLSPEIAAHLSKTDVHEAACRDNGEAGFGRIEADMLFAFVSSHKPGAIFQIGCGVSTALCVAAARFAEYSPRIICVEPYPTPFLKGLATEGVVELIQNRVQDIDLSTIDGLPNDVLFFVDSSHTLGPGGEVSRIILEMLPRLKVGARVHFHDILFPYDYSRRILTEELFFWHESIMLHAFLAYNSRFSILASCSMLHYGARQELQNVLSNYSPATDDRGLNTGIGHFPSSIYLLVAK
jgi:Methyltransferase domain